MRLGSGWIQEFWRILVLIGVALAVGYVLDQLLLSLLLVLLVYTFRNLFNLQRLADWLGDPQVDRIPINFGLWGDIYARVARVNTRHEQRERRLTQLVNEYAASTSALPDATVAFDAEGRIRWFNDAASRLLHLQPAKDVGQPLANLFRNPDIVAFLKAVQYERPLQTGAPGDPQRRLELRLAPYGDGQKLLLAQDITERVRHERVRKDFVANVSHELRTPLTVISGFVENLRNDPGFTDPRLQRPLELMEQQAQRMRQIVEDLLLLARLEGDTNATAAQVVGIGGLLESVAEECRSLRPAVPEIRCEISSQRSVLGDEKQLRSLVSNLAVNAVHHTPARGRVTLLWEDSGAHALLRVVDNGEGIEPQHIERLTERFYRVDTGRSRERGGTGLGLAIVKHILHRHQAVLEIRSQLGQGSTFTCRFPPARLTD